ncbi:MAG: hypothetical protein B6I32_00800, partial [Desulfobacterium sp. 4572_20]
VSSAHKYNRNERHKFLNYLKKNTKIDISMANQNESKSLLLSDLWGHADAPYLLRAWSKKRHTHAP